MEKFQLPVSNVSTVPLSSRQLSLEFSLFFLQRRAERSQTFLAHSETQLPLCHILFVRDLVLWNLNFPKLPFLRRKGHAQSATISAATFDVNCVLFCKQEHNALKAGFLYETSNILLADVFRGHQSQVCFGACTAHPPRQSPTHQPHAHKPALW